MEHRKNQQEVHHSLYDRLPDTLGLVRHYALDKHAYTLIG